MKMSMFVPVTQKNLLSSPYSTHKECQYPLLPWFLALPTSTWCWTLASQYLGWPSILRADSANNQAGSSHILMGVSASPEGCRFQTHQLQPTLGRKQNTSTGQEFRQAGTCFKHPLCWRHSAKCFLPQFWELIFLQGRYYSFQPNNSGNKRL